MNWRWFIPLGLAFLGFVGGLLSSDEPADAPQTASRSPGQSAPQAGTAEPPLSVAERTAALAARLRIAADALSRAHRAHALAELFAETAAEDLPALAEEALKLSEPLLLEALFAQWVQLDVRAAQAFADAPRTYRFQRDQLRDAVVRAWAAHDPPASARWVQERPQGERGLLRRALARGVTERFREDPVNGLLFMRDSGLAHDARLYGDLLRLATERDAPGVMAFASQIENPLRRRELLKVAVQGWAESDPAAAAAWMQRVSDSKLQREAAMAITIALAQNDLAQSLAFARALPEVRDRDRALAALAEALAKSRRGTEAADFALEIPFETNQAALTEFYTVWSMTDPGAAIGGLLDRLDRAAPGGTERTAIEELFKLTRVADVAGASGAQFLAGSIPAQGDALRERLLAQSVAGWTSKDLPAARVWVEALAEGPARHNALLGLTKSWTANSPHEVAVWLNTFPASPSRDAAVAGFVLAAMPRDPAGSLAWLRTIVGAEVRLTTMQTAWRQWNRDRTEEATQWRDHSPDLTPAERARLARSP